MKKISLTLFFLFSMGISVHAHDAFFNASLRMYLTRYLIDRNVAVCVELFNVDPLIIRNLIGMENIKDNPNAAEDKYGIYDFRSENQILAFSFILIRSNDEYEILDLISKNRLEIKTELVAYFDRHPEVSSELLPLYVDAVNNAKREYHRLEKAWGVRIKKDKFNDSVYHFINKSTGKALELSVTID